MVPIYGSTWGTGKKGPKCSEEELLRVGGQGAHAHRLGTNGAFVFGRGWAEGLHKV